jgi:hypothetical protein
MTDGDAPDVLLLGDSVSVRVAHEDSDSTDLAGMVARELLPPMRTCSIAASGYHAGVFREIVRLLEVMPHRPRVIVLPINLRSFFPQWALNPLWSYDGTIRAIKRYGRLSGRVIPKIRPEHASRRALRHYLDVEVSNPILPGRTIGEICEVIARPSQTDQDRIERQRVIFAFHYLHALDGTHPRLTAVHDAVRTATTLGIPVVVYVVPINYEAGRELLGASFTERLADNVTVISRVVERASGPPGTEFFDWSTLLGPEAFFHRFEPTEHLNEHGRRTLADHIAAAARQRLTV